MRILSKNKSEVVTYTRLSEVPEVAAARSGLYSLHQRRDSLLNQINELHSGLAEDGSAINATRRTQYDDAAAEVLAGLSTTGSASTAIATPSKIRADIEQLCRDHRIILRAIEIQRKLVEQAEERGIRAIRESFLDRHRAVGREIGRCLKALESALQADLSLRDEMEEAQITVGHPLQWIGFRGTGDVSNGRTFYNIDRWFEENDAYVHGETAR